MTNDTKPNELENVAALDLETSGLDEQNDQILEVAVVFGSIVDGKFIERSRFERVLPLITDIEKWHEAVVEMHTKNGLLSAAIKEKKARAAGPPVSAFDVCDRELFCAAPALPGPKHRFTLLGNSVHFDLRFVRRVFPTFAKLLSHRCFDISATRLFCESLGMVTEPADVPHRAMSDVLASIAQYEKQAAWVRDHFMHAGAVAQATPFEVTFSTPQLSDSDLLSRLGPGAPVGHGAG